MQKNFNAQKPSPQGRVKVCVRVRPPFESELEDIGFQNVISTRHSPGSKSDKIAVFELNSQFREFTFDTVFGPHSNQEDIYNTIGYPVVQDVLRGFNGTIMAYGQTGTGKTYTMGILGSAEGKDVGLVPRALSHIFNSIQGQQGWTVKISFIQIYMEMIQDLLQPENNNLSIREDSEKGVYVPGLTEECVSNVDEAMAVLMRGLQNRIIAPTLMNITSSRAHTILALEVTRTSLNYNDVDFSATLRLVDLAGSERVQKTRSSGSRLDEAKRINKSLSVLGNVISGLGDPRTTHIPYRDSKLTRLLQDALGGNSNTYLIATVSPAKDCIHETLSTLMFAQRCMKVKTYAVVNEHKDYKALADRLQAELSALKTEFIMRENSTAERYESMIRSLLSGSEHLYQQQSHGGGTTNNNNSNTATNGGNSKADATVASTADFSRDLDLAWGLINAMYDTLWDLHRLIGTNLGLALERGKRLHTEWIRQIEESDNQTTGTPTTTADDASQTNINNNTMSSNVSSQGSFYGPFTDTGLDPVSVRGEEIREILSRHPSKLDELELEPGICLGRHAEESASLEFKSPQDCTSAQEFVQHIGRLHRTIVNETYGFSRLLEAKEWQFETVKHELVDSAVERRIRENELENWSSLLKTLLNTNTLLRKNLQKKTGIDEAIRLNNAVTILQNQFRRKQQMRRREQQQQQLELDDEYDRFSTQAVASTFGGGGGGTTTTTTTAQSLILAHNHHQSHHQYLQSQPPAKKQHPMMMMMAHTNSSSSSSNITPHPPPPPATSVVSSSVVPGGEPHNIRRFGSQIGAIAAGNNGNNSSSSSSIFTNKRSNINPTSTNTITLTANTITTSNTMTSTSSVLSSSSLSDDSDDDDSDKDNFSQLDMFVRKFKGLGAGASGGSASSSNNNNNSSSNNIGSYRS